MNRILVSSSLAAAALMAIPATAAAAEQAAPESLEARVHTDCAWIDAAVEQNPGRDDAFGVVMKALQDQCRVLVPKLGTDRAQRQEMETLHDEIASLRDAVGPLKEEPGAEKAEEAGRAEEKKAEEKAEKGEKAEEKAEKAEEKAEKAEKAEDEAGRADPRPRGITGTWHQEPEKFLDHFVKRTFELTEKEDGEVTGEMTEVTWRKAPMSWVQKSCDGNPIFRSVTVARVRGDVDGNELTLLRNRPQVVKCTCGSRCRVERRRRGFEFTVGSGRNVLRHGDMVFVREGARVGGVVGGGSPGSEGGGAAAAGPRTFEGVWETKPFNRAGETHRIRLDLQVDGDEVNGTLSERVSQDLPLATWRDRFCEGNDRFEYVEVFDARGDVDGDEVDLRFRTPRILSCTCPSKCRTPRRRRGLSLNLSPEGAILEGGGLEFHRPGEE